jgi:hypothetical protein
MNGFQRTIYVTPALLYQQGVLGGDSECGAI